MNIHVVPTDSQATEAAGLTRHDATFPVLIGYSFGERMGGIRPRMRFDSAVMSRFSVIDISRRGVIWKTGIEFLSYVSIS